MRKIYIDYLRVMAVISVITIHVTAKHYHGSIVGGADWWVANILDSLARYSVPMFVVISGATLLRSGLSIKDFCKQRASRLFPPLLFWTVFYIAFTTYIEGGENNLGWFLKIGLFADGKAYFHLWYLSMFLCLMVFAPFIIYFVNGTEPNKTELIYFLVACTGFFILNFISLLSAQFVQISISWFKLFPWYIAYFVAGCFFEKYGKSLNISIQSLIMTATAVTGIGIIANYVVASSFGIVRDCFILDNIAPMVLIITLSLFLACKNWNRGCLKIKSLKPSRNRPLVFI